MSEYKSPTPDYEEFRNYGKQMVEYVSDYMKTMETRKVMDLSIVKNGPGFLPPLLPTEAPELPESYEKVMKDFNDHIMPGMLHWQHPHFFAYFSNGNSWPTLLAEMLSTSMAPVGFSWASCPSVTELEGIVLDWFAKAIGLPQQFLSKRTIEKSLGGGCIQGSASDAIYAVMFAARKRVFKMLRGEGKKMVEPECLPNLVCYASKEAHSCVEKAAIMNLVQYRGLIPDENDRLTGETLEKAIQEDVAKGHIPFFVNATLGTTGQGEFDHLEEMGKVCAKYKTIWFHADGAYGGNSMLLPEMRPAGLEYLDSIEVNPNKLMLTAFDCTCLWIKNVVTFTEAFAIDPVYLQTEFKEKVIDLRHYGSPLSRRFRSLKLYFLFRLFGLKRLKEYIQRVIEMGHYFKELMETDTRFEILNRVHLGVICFRLKKQCNGIQQKLLGHCNNSGKLWMIPATARGRYIVRFVAGQEFCNKEQIKDAFEAIQKAATLTLLPRTPAMAPSSDMPSDVEMGGEVPQEMDKVLLERLSFTRIVSKAEYEQENRKQIMFDGAAGMLVIEG